MAGIGTKGYTGPIDWWGAEEHPTLAFMSSGDIDEIG
jgi:hypothetical protein